MLLETARLALGQPPPSRAAAVVDFYERNRAHLAPWDPVRAPEFYTEPYWARRLEEDRRERRDGRSLRLFLWRPDAPERVLGACNFTAFVRGVFQACNLGYAVDGAEQGRGLMREALEVAIDHVFAVERMHRVMAAYVPTNERSGRLLRSLGFRVEGYAPAYLFLGGRWVDHVLTAKVNPDLSTPEVGAPGCLLP